MKTQNPPTDPGHRFSPPPFRFVHSATSAVRSQGENHPLTVLAFVTFALQRNGSGRYHPRFYWGSSLAVDVCLTGTILDFIHGHF